MNRRKMEKPIYVGKRESNQEIPQIFWGDISILKSMIII